MSAAENRAKALEAIRLTKYECFGVLEANQKAMAAFHRASIYAPDQGCYHVGPH